MPKTRRRVPVRRRKRISSQELEEISKKMETIKCAFCQGTGKDPFQLLSKLSNCQVCLGGGKIRIEGPTTRCKFCGGTGVQPYTGSRFHCLACGGKGVVTAVEPSRPCPTCKGTGIYSCGSQLLPCLTCRGQGVIFFEEESKIWP